MHRALTCKPERQRLDATVIRFTTKLFDVTKERPNDINPTYGESLHVWLAERLKGEVVVPEPQTEDWGRYVDIDWKGRHAARASQATVLAGPQVS